VVKPSNTLEGALVCCAHAAGSHASAAKSKGGTLSGGLFAAAKSKVESAVKLVVESVVKSRQAVSGQILTSGQTLTGGRIRGQTDRPSRPCAGDIYAYNTAERVSRGI
jgi:hypothetical protein